MGTEKVRVTVCTPTYNRAHLLPRVYESLRRQTVRAFEWLVGDDGSTDNTRELVESWRSQADFPIRYWYQENAGKHVALNRGAELALGHLYAIVDSDDWYEPDAIETFLELWDSIDHPRRASYAGICALAATAEGEVIGSRFPSDRLTTRFSDFARIGVTGDKAGANRTEIVRQFPFPVFPGERLIIESIQLGRIAGSYDVLAANQVVLRKEYQEDGLSAAGAGAWIESPRTAELYYDERLRRTSGFKRLHSYANRTRFAFHAGHGASVLASPPSQALSVLTAPAGLAAYLRDRVRHQ